MLFRAQQRAAPEEIIELEPIPQTVATTTSTESRAAAAAPAAAAAAAAVVLASEASSTLNKHERGAVARRRIRRGLRDGHAAFWAA